MIKISSRYGSTRFLSGEPELELTTLNGELVLRLTTPAGLTTNNLKENCEIFSQRKLYLFENLSREITNSKVLII